MGSGNDDACSNEGAVACGISKLESLGFLENKLVPKPSGVEGIACFGNELQV